MEALLAAPHSAHYSQIADAHVKEAGRRGLLHHNCMASAAPFVSSPQSAPAWHGVNQHPLARRPAQVHQALIAARCNKPTADMLAAGQQQVGSFELPALCSRFSLRLGPHQESIREECESWGLSLLDASSGSSSASPAERQAFLNARYYLCGCIFFPDCCSRRRTALLTKYYILGFVFDDVIELSAAPQEAAALLHASNTVWSAGSTSVAGGAGIPTALAAPTATECSRMVALMGRYKEEAWEEMCSDVRTPAVRARLERLNLEWLQKVGEYVQTSAQFETMEEYMAFRVVEIGAKVFLALVEYSLDVDLHEQCMSIPMLVQFREAAVNHFVWVNDLLSLRKEVIQHPAGGYARGSIGVLLGQLMRKNSTATSINASVALQQCIDKLWDMIQEEEVRIASLVDEVKAQFPASSDLLKYVEALCGVLANHMYWYTISGRYSLLHAKFFHGQPASALPTLVSLLPDDPTLQVNLRSLAFTQVRAS